MLTRFKKLVTGATGLICFLVVTTGAFAAIVDPLYTKPVMDPLLQPKFVNPLPNPLVPGFIVSPNPAKPTGFAGDFYTVSVRQFRQSLGLVDEVTKAPITTMVWGYGDARETNNPATGFPNGGGGITSGFHTYPGPTFEVKSTLPLPVGQTPLVAGKYPGLPVRVQWTNELLDVNGLPLQNHLLPVDTTLNCGVNAPSCFPYNRIVTHVHGAHVADDSDGHPDAWISANFETTGMNFRPNTKYGPIGTYNYQNDQESGTIWYHDHAMGITRLNVMAGLAGFFLIRDDNEERLQNSPVTATQKGVLPKYPFEVPIAIQDRTFFPDGSIAVPDQPLTNPVIQPLMVPPITVAGPTVFDNINVKPVPSIVPEFFGNMILVNGQTWPVLNVEPRKYRFRILNGSDSRTYILRFQTTTGLTDRGRFWVVGTEQGLLNVPSRQTQLVIMPGERMDVIINFAGAAAGAQFVLGNYGPDGPYSNIAPTAASIPPIANPATTGQVMAFKIVALNSTPLPAGEVGPRLDTINLTTTTPLRGAVPAYSSPVIAPLAATAGAPIRKLSLMEAFDEFGRLKLTIEGKAFMDKPSEIPKLNAVETWEIVNPTPDSHPMHLHLVKFQIVNRQPFDMLTFVPPTPYAPATYTLLGAAVLPPSFENGWKDTVRTNPGEVTRIRAKFDIPGMYVWHCHILSHEEHEMMRPLVVVTPATGASIMASSMAQAVGSGIPVTFEASAVPDTDGFEYRFWVKDPVTNLWIVKQPYSSKRMFTWIPPNKIGAYGIQVDVRQMGSVATREKQANIQYFVNATLPTVTVASSLISPQNRNNPITFTATGANGTGSYQYRFWLKTGTAWAIVQDYSTTNTWTWPAGAAGTYGIQVDIRNGGSTAFREAQSNLVFVRQ